MIERVGLLNQGLEDMSSIAWDLYCNWENAGQPIQNEGNGVGATVLLVADFKTTFSRSNTEIYFMGLWDTVNSVGLIIDRMFPYTIRSSIVLHVRHAVSIDERRAKFKQLLFGQGYPYLILFGGNESYRSADTDESESLDHESAADSAVARFLDGLIGRRRGPRLRSVPSQDMVEVYFPGNHGDCGGGWARDRDNQRIADVPLRWMLLEAIKNELLFKRKAIHEFNSQHPSSASFLSCNHDLLSLKVGGTNQHEERGWTALVRGDVGSLLQQQRALELEMFQRAVPRLLPVNQGPPPPLPSAPVKRFDSRGNVFWGNSIFWWFIELLPFGFKVENRYGEWRRVYGPNFGRHRKIASNSVLHWSVFYRLHYCEDYDPTNLPAHDIGDQFLELLKGFENAFRDIDLIGYCKGLTVQEIREDWGDEHPIWRIIPDELECCLASNPNL